MTRKTLIYLTALIFATVVGFLSFFAAFAVIIYIYPAVTSEGFTVMATGQILLTLASSVLIGIATLVYFYKKLIKSNYLRLVKPTDFNGLKNLGYYYLEQNKYPEALQVFEEAKKGDPSTQGIGDLITKTENLVRESRCAPPKC
ncbi:M48 family metallopeptidase [Pedobacter sp. SYSU D00535]|uniref:tetratricopeptide repeat protein n=1 Tax=Pedobacter sp. SYSU D00535 TaxID=2810308 RepID=UPI001A95835C|nr:tetratricopeptide repeat protein [Pedobacter sp. SYSU D00535]